MAFSITYRRSHHANATFPGIFQANDLLQTEWITPEGWDACRAQTAFEDRHPGCTVIRCDDIGNPYGNLP